MLVTGNVHTFKYQPIVFSKNTCYYWKKSWLQAGSAQVDQKYQQTTKDGWIVEEAEVSCSGLIHALGKDVCIYIYIIVEKSPSHMYDHGFMDNTNRQAVCKSQKNPLSDSQTAEELHWKP